MSLKEIKDLIQVMNEHDLQELEIEREGFKVRLVKKGAGKVIPHIVETPPTAIQETRLENLEKVPSPTTPPNTVTIKAPMVGTFYATPSPDAAPFVDQASTIEEGQVICIIEAMKLMNEIKSEVRGKVIKVLVENGQPVEFGQPLFLVEKSV